MPSGVRAQDLTSVTDEDLVALYHRGQHPAIDALLERYRNFARMKARSYFLAGADKDDIVQEGMIGLYKAIRDFVPDRQASFRAFAEVCITRQIITAVKTATRQKHGPLNSYVSLSKPLAGDDDAEWVLMDVLETPQVSDPAELVISNDELQSIKMAFAEILSRFETEVLHMYVEGKSYQEIADHLGRHVKSVDNALQRIKRKVELHLRHRAGAGSAEGPEQPEEPSPPRRTSLRRPAVASRR
ncbi:MAG TPA: RNA polymerase sporulation sigma factor SigH [Actinomycetota bacterium]|nr:RNA polymerase sporulation sigma factor SigH [Actinomycetota bacterium]